MTEKINTWQYPTLANITTVILIGIVFGVVGWNVWSAYEESIKEFNFPALEILKPITITAYQPYADGTSDLIYNQTKPNYINITFTTTSLSALNPITISATMEIRDITDEQWDGIQTVYIISYPDAFIYNDTGNFYENSAILLEKVPNSHKYAGEQTIVFPFAGKYGLAIVNLDDASDKKITKDGKYTTAVAAFTNLHEKIIKKSEIVIEPSISATIVKLTILAQALVWILIGIGILQLRNHVIHGVMWIENLRRNVVSNDVSNDV